MRARNGRGVADEDILIRGVESVFPGLDFARLNRDRLGLISQRCGCDFATALLYDRVRREPRFASFIAAIDAQRASKEPAPRLRAKVLVAPAALYRELPQFGGDGAIIREVAESFGWSCGLLPSESASSVSRNAALIRDALLAESPDPVVVISLSKGAADVRLALQALDPVPRALRAWVQICGLVRGSPLIDDILRSRIRRTFLRAYMAYLDADLSVCNELRWRDNPILDGPCHVPEGLEVVNVVGFPLSRHLSGNTKRRHRQLERFGPNDGSTLLRDAIVEPGVVYPVWGADHYFRVPEARDLLSGLFRYFATRWSA